MTCVCGSDRIISVGGKTSDMSWASYKDLSHNGYVISGLGVGRSDYLEIDFCADCGRLQTTQGFPLSDEDIREAFED